MNIKGLNDKKFPFLYFRSQVVENSQKTQNVFSLVSDKKMGSQS